MLGKLLKHELKASARMMLPVYIVLLVLTFTTKLFLVINAPNTALAVFEGISATMYGLCIVAMFIMTTVVSIYRFYKNLTTDEGYLMFTLPVKPWQLIISKMLISIFWGVVCTLLFLVSLFILLLTDINMFEIVNAFAVGMGEIHAELQGTEWLYGAELLILILTSVLSEILNFYACIAIGQCFQKNRIAFAILAYIIISIVLQIVFTFGFMAVGFAGDALNFSSFGPNEIRNFFHWMLNGMSLINMIIGVGFFITTNEIFKRRLNLE